VRSFDQPRDIGNHEAALIPGVAYRDDTEVGLQRGEWVIRNLGMR
jgi:hypothetical protein